MVPVNLLPWRTLRLQRQWRGWCWLVLLLPVLSLPAWIAGQWQYQLNRQQAALLASQVGAQKLAAALQARMQAVQQQLSVLQQHDLRQQQRQYQLQLWRDFVRQIAQVIPEDVWLMALNSSPQGGELKGASRSVAAVHQFADQLSQSNSVLRVLPGQMIRKAEDEVHFGLQIHLRQALSQHD